MITLKYVLTLHKILLVILHPEHPDQDNMPLTPPRLAQRLLLWFLKEEMDEEVMGDLEEQFEARLEETSPFRAKLSYWYQVFHYLRPFAIRNLKVYHTNPNHYTMYKSYFKIGWRNLFKHKGYSFINIGGLAAGMAVAMLIGLWIYDELSFNQYHENYGDIVQVMRHETYEGERETGSSQVPGLGTLLGSTYDRYFEYVVPATQTAEFVVATEDKKLTEIGSYMQAEAPEMLSLRMQQGTRSGLQDMRSILISATLADKLFADTDPIGQSLTINASQEVKVSGVYEDLPVNSEFHELKFILPLALFFAVNDWTGPDVWDNYFMRIYAQVRPTVGIEEASEAVKDAMLAHIDPEDAASAKPEVFLHPMSHWHLHSQFENGVNVGSKESMFVWFFGITGIFVLLLACINFMNLSTARSEKRAKEVGIRKSVGSVRRQLISQFLSESLLVAVLAFILAMVLVWVTLPWFNDLAGKKMDMLWLSPEVWGVLLLFTLLTGLLAGSYPAFYLSSFQAVSVLKGSFRAGRFAALPRKVLVVFQFTISIALIIGTIMVYQQIQFVKDRPVGYSREGLLTLPMNSPEYYEAYERLRNELIRTGAVANVAKSSRPLTNALGWNEGFNWPGKDPDAEPAFNTIWVSYDYGNTIGWEVVAGRDFSRDFATDTTAIIINESALKLMGLDNPVGQVVSFEPSWDERRELTIVGVVKDMVKESPYEATFPSIIFNSDNDASWLFIKINPQLTAQEALPQIEAVLSELVPSAPFDYKFVDDEYDAKFRNEERIGKLAGVFALLAIFISCLGLFGLSSFVVEQRTKEIGIRKVFGASVAQLWRLLSKDFVILVIISCLVAIPVAYYFLHGWLENYAYRTELSWWIFAAAGMGTLLITLLTVSFQSIKAALANPVDSLRNE